MDRRRGDAHSRTVLFVCQFNSARSQLAEALARRLAPATIHVVSAGLVRSVVNEEVLRALAEIGVDAADQTSKSIDDVVAASIDEVFALCEEARAPTALRFPNAVHHFWPMKDPIAVGDPTAMPAEVRRARDELRRRVEAWVRDLER